MTEEEYFVRFAAALFAAFRTDSKPTDLARDIERTMEQALPAAQAAMAAWKQAKKK
jgi:hypothetical protein